jgi:hypothetical protein
MHSASSNSTRRKRLIVPRGEFDDKLTCGVLLGLSRKLLEELEWKAAQVMTVTARLAAW